MSRLSKLGSNEPTPTARAATVAPRLPGGRASWDSADSFPSSTWLMQPPSAYTENWALMNMDSRYLARYSPIRLMEMMADLSPEVSRALWDFLRLCNPGWEVEAKRPGSDTKDDRAQGAITAFIASMADRYGSFDIVIGRLFMGPFLRGAICAELVLDERGRMPLDIATPDPSSIRFRRKSDPVFGSVWQPGQWQQDFKPLDIPTFRYVPIDPMPSSPYGRPLAAPALFTSVFLLGMLHDLKRVIQQQGYPRLDISVDIDQLLQSMPGLGQNPAEFESFAQSMVDSVQSIYSQLEPDDAYIHTSNVSVNKPVGAVDASSLGGVDAVIVALERMAVRALKTMPLMMGITDNIGDVQSNRQFEIFIAGIKSIQHYMETMLGRLFTLGLQAQGIQADVEFRFSEVRGSEEMRDSQTEQMRIANEVAKVNAGWITDDEAAEAITGHKAKGTKIAQQAPPQTPGIGNIDGEPSVVSGNNAMFLNEVRAARADIEKTLAAISVNGYHSPVGEL